MSLMNGVVVGLVTAVDEAIPGRIKARFTSSGEAHETDWFRIATAMAGGNRGTFFMPEVDDEVLIAFDRSDVRFPYCVGFLWNGVDTPPAPHVRLRRIQSRNGHRISFLDSTEVAGSKGALVIEDAHGNKITLSNGKITIKSVGILQLEAPHIRLNKRVVSPNANPI
jgi:uncharacterized protein involved in type VI secretion and phage assembly